MSAFAKKVNHPNLSVVSSAPSKRKPRTPSHTFHIRAKPFQLQPFMIAPVLAGETMKNLLLQARVVTDPIKNPLIGWWQEHYFFYVKLRDLQTNGLLGERDGAGSLTNMLLDQAADNSGMEASADMLNYYTRDGDINYVWACQRLVMDQFFADADLQGNYQFLEASPTTADVPIVQINQHSWLDSHFPEASIPTDAVDVEAGTPDTVPLDPFDSQYKTWLFLREQKLTNMDFEDYLASFGIRRPLVENNKAELIRFARNWQYPSNTINPSTGAPTSAVSWSVSERADKDRFFSEPGFVIGLTVSRPKVYLSNQASAAVGMMSDAMSWLPAMLRDDPATSLKHMAEGTGALGDLYDGTPSGGYWFDMRDLLVYGDQFINFALTATDAGLVALPTDSHVEQRYVSGTDVDALFVDAAGGKNYVKQDGIVDLNILSVEQDYT